jgi:hypothetical protein
MKTEAEKIQLRISQRLKRMERGTTNSNDIQFLWNWTHKLHEYANQLETRVKDGENKLRQIREILKEM